MKRAFVAVLLLFPLIVWGCGQKVVELDITGMT